MSVAAPSPEKTYALGEQLRSARSAIYLDQGTCFCRLRYQADQNCHETRHQNQNSRERESARKGRSLKREGGSNAGRMPAFAFILRREALRIDDHEPPNIKLSALLHVCQRPFRASCAGGARHSNRPSRTRSRTKRATHHPVFAPN
jgi:hypothetical protein